MSKFVNLISWLSLKFRMCRFCSAVSRGRMISNSIKNYKLQSHKKVHKAVGEAAVRSRAKKWGGRRVLAVFSRVIRKFKANIGTYILHIRMTQPLEPWILISVGPYHLLTAKVVHYIGWHIFNTWSLKFSATLVTPNITDINLEKIFPKKRKPHRNNFDLSKPGPPFW